MTRRRTDPTFVFLAAVAVVVALGAGLALVLGGDDDGDQVAPTTTTAPPDPAITCPGADGRSRELRRCLEESFAFIETPLATGSGVLLADGRVLTNAHVVDPYEVVDVTFPGGERHEAVQVVGIDAFSDIAVLERIETERTGVTIGPNPDLDADEEPEVFLVGYPGGVEGSDPHVTLASGILSRVRRIDTFDSTYYQTDAAIAGGQSGGALVDSEGRLLGISGLGFAQEFALALSADDVLEAIGLVLDGNGHDRRTIPALDETGSESIQIELPGVGAIAQAILPAAGDERTVLLTVTADRPVAITAFSFFGEPLGANLIAIDAADDLGDFGEFGDEFGDVFGDAFGDVFGEVLPEVSPGTYELEVPADEDVIVSLAFADEAPGAVAVDADVPFVVHPSTVAPVAIELGATVDAVVDAFTFERLYTVDLAAGDEIEIAVRGAASDPYYVFLEPGETRDQTEGPTTDDGGGGLYDLDAVDSHSITVDGTYTIVVGTFDGIVSGYQLSVSAVE